MFFPFCRLHLALRRSRNKPPSAYTDNTPQSGPITSRGAIFMSYSFSSSAFHLVYLLLGIGNPQSFPPPLPIGEERRLFFEMKKGDTSARSKLIEHNLRLVAHVVRKYYTPTIIPTSWFPSVASGSSRRSTPLTPITARDLPPMRQNAYKTRS